jgi:para-nitrobenzyl esterase
MDATKFGNSCPQDPSPFGIASLNEDCLFLNVFSPNDEIGSNCHHHHPVMVWIHGGGLIWGESNDYDPSKLVAKGDVVVVTINYRLGALGFLAHPALTAESPDHTSGNYGTMDQQFALKWVQRNIAAFGGDPNSVTIFGESAGGLSVFSHLASPSAVGLFHRGIVESGAYALGFPTLTYEESQNEAFATSIGCNDQTARCLRSKSVEEILQNWGPFDSTPVVDGKVFPQSPDTAFVSGQFNHVPLIHGTNHDEWRLLVALSYDLAGGPITPAEYPAAIVDTVGPDALQQILAEYPLDHFDSPDLAVGAIGTDSNFACVARSVDQVLASQVPTFAYEFNDSDAPEPFLPPVSFPYGAAHLSELRYLFKLRQHADLSAAQRELSDDMVAYWTQFARSGDPNSSRTPLWHRYDPHVDEFQSLVPPSPVPEMAFSTDHKCDFWATLSGASARRGARVSK